MWHSDDTDVPNYIFLVTWKLCPSAWRGWVPEISLTWNSCWGSCLRMRPLVCIIHRNALLPLYLVWLLLRHRLVNCKEGLLNSSMIGVPILTKQMIKPTRKVLRKMWLDISLLNWYSFTLMSVKNWLVTSVWTTKKCQWVFISYPWQDHTNEC